VHIAITWHSEQFNIDLASKEGAEAFLSVKGCRLVDGADGSFISYPATKNANTGKWWRHVWASDKFNAAVMEKVLASKPQQARGAGRTQRQDDGLGDIPFSNPLAGKQWLAM
jgi:hypothetical protein